MADYTPTTEQIREGWAEIIQVDCPVCGGFKMADLEVGNRVKIVTLDGTERDRVYVVAKIKADGPRLYCRIREEGRPGAGTFAVITSQLRLVGPDER